MRTIIGRRGEKRPADVAANAAHVGRLLVGDIEETYVEEPNDIPGEDRPVSSRPQSKRAKSQQDG